MAGSLSWKGLIGRNISGQLDELRIWEIARTAAEIRSNIYTPLTGNESGLVSYYQMDQPSTLNLMDTKDLFHGDIQYPNSVTYILSTAWAKRIVNSNGALSIKVGYDFEGSLETIITDPPSHGTRAKPCGKNVKMHSKLTVEESAGKEPKLLDQACGIMRRKHMALSTERSYLSWMRQYILFHNKQNPKDMGEREIEQFLTSLALDRNVAASTQNQAFNAILFLYREVLNIELDEIDSFRADEPDRLPVVCTKDECYEIFSYMKGTHLLICKMLYGSGMRLKECLRLRIKDIDYSVNEIVVRSGKGKKDRSTIFPDSLKPEITAHIRKVKIQHETDLAKGFGSVYMPYALAKKYPNASWQWGWQYVFPAARLSV
jgi:integron integrase